MTACDLQTFNADLQCQAQFWIELILYWSAGWPLFIWAARRSWYHMQHKTWMRAFKSAESSVNVWFFTFLLYFLVHETTKYANAGYDWNMCEVCHRPDNYSTLIAMYTLNFFAVTLLVHIFRCFSTPGLSTEKMAQQKPVFLVWVLWIGVCWPFAFTDATNTHQDTGMFVAREVTQGAGWFLVGLAWLFFVNQSMGRRLEVKKSRKDEPETEESQSNIDTQLQNAENACSVMLSMNICGCALCIGGLSRISRGIWKWESHLAQYILEDVLIIYSPTLFALFFGTRVDEAKRGMYKPIGQSTSEAFLHIQEVLKEGGTSRDSRSSARMTYIPPQMEDHRAFEDIRPHLVIVEQENENKLHHTHIIEDEKQSKMGTTMKMFEINETMTPSRYALRLPQMLLEHYMEDLMDCQKVCKARINAAMSTAESTRDNQTMRKQILAVASERAEIMSVQKEFKALNDNWVKHLNRVHNELGMMCRYQEEAAMSSERPLPYAPFKPSRNRKVTGIAGVATNLFVYSTAGRKLPPTNNVLHIPSNTTAAAADSKPPESEESRIFFTVVSLGAPSDHASKSAHDLWKAGELRKDAESKLKVEVLKTLSASGLRETVLKAEQQLFEAQSRATFVLPQAISGVVTVVANHLCVLLDNSPPEQVQRKLKQYRDIGFLYHASSLLTDNGAEEVMLGDMRGAFEFLKNVCFCFAAKEGSQCTLLEEPCISVVEAHLLDSRLERAGTTSICLHWSAEHYEQIRHIFSDDTMRMNLVPVLFTVGVNEKESINFLKPNEIAVNRTGLADLKDYVEKYQQFVDSHAEFQDNKEMENLERMRQDQASLEIDIHEASSKNVATLKESSRIARLCGGGLSVSCKSAKDRTGMLTTWQAAECFLQDVVKIRSHNRDKLIQIANVLRTNGVRLQNCELNTGKLAYAFNSLQVSQLPEELRPPASSVGNVET